jgi:hypothetical protein
MIPMLRVIARRVLVAFISLIAGCGTHVVLLAIPGSRFAISPLSAARPGDGRGEPDRPPTPTA